MEANRKQTTKRYIVLAIVDCSNLERLFKE